MNPSPPVIPARLLSWRLSPDWREYVLGDLDKPAEFATPALTLQGDVTAPRLQSRRDLLRAIDDALEISEQTEI